MAERWDGLYKSRYEIKVFKNFDKDSCKMPIYGKNPG
jgi:hypothetical protein